MFTSNEEYEPIERKLQEHEDEEDIHEAAIAVREVKEKGSISFDVMKKRIGL